MSSYNQKLSSRNSGSRKASATSKPTAVDRKIQRKAKNREFAFAKPSVVPPGTYRSEVISVENSWTKAGEEAVDFLYELTAASGRKYRVRMRYILDGFYFESLCDALLDAGLEEGSKISDAIVIEEEVTLGYPNGERIGSFTDRRPVGCTASVSNNNVVDDEETEDFAEENLADEALDDDDEFDEILDEEDD